MRGVDVEVGRIVPQVEHAEEPGPVEYTPDPDYADWTDEQVADEAAKVTAEHGRRQAMTEAVAAAETASRTFLAASGRHEGGPWAQPTGAHDAYPQGWTVVHGGKTWESLTPANVWEPGVSGWREVTEDGGEPAVWVQPTGAHDAYAAGDRVTHEGQVWVSDLDGNVWSPGEYGWTVDSE